MKKRILSLVLAASLLLSLTPVGLAASQNFYFNGDSNNCQSFAIVGDSVYMLVQDGEMNLSITRWQAGMEEPEVVISKGLVSWRSNKRDIAVSQLFTDGACLYGLETSEGGVCLLVNENGKAAEKNLFNVTLPTSESFGFPAADTVYGLFAADGALHLLTAGYDQLGLESKYMRCDLATGETLAAFDDDDISRVTAIAPYKDGQLLAFVKAEDASAPLRLCTLDPETGDLAELGTSLGSSDTGLVYDQQSDAIYFISGDTVYRFVQGDAPAASVYLPRECMLEDYKQAYGLLSDGTFVALTFMGVAMRELGTVDPTASTLLVRVYDDAHYALGAQNPDLPMHTNIGAQDPAGLVAAFTDEEAPLDVLLLRSSSTELNTLAEAGHLADLGGIPGVKEYLQQLDQSFTDSLIGENGEVYGLPVNLSMITLGYMPDVLKALRMDEDDLPKTWLALFDLMANWDSEYGKKHSDILPFSQQLDQRYSLLTRLLESHAAYQLRTEGAVTYDTPLMHELLTAMEQVDFVAYDFYETYGESFWDNMPMEFFSQSGLLSLHSNIGATSQGDENAGEPFLLALDDSAEPILPYTLRLLVVRADTPNMALAERYVSAYLASIPEETLLLLAPMLNESATESYRENYFPYLCPVTELEYVTWFDAPIDDTTSPMVPYLQHKTSIDEFLQAMDVYYATEAP